ncbi:amino acid adenylation domain-containing protein [Corynebacterium lowii]|uniref:Tyrocidine synthase 3 n=1 Tax=Corynebacterium lowii TaxID=1544413 RepID=A0A0Q0Z3S1_9CORY|nr:amino acid adenylation domain-containing protein [Corynebacterium lowii]KQB83982.1 Tyrocidine synthase 3 [Corynebacterium lowii]MDP9852768.1 amino acid adenylation domain-containing protein [Corynebacterium lowii]
MELHTTNSAATVAELLERTLEQAKPEHKAIRVEGGETISYPQLRELSGALARRLLAAGVQVGDRVAVVAGRSPWQVIAAVAVIRAGGVYVPVDSSYPAARIAGLLRESEPAVVLHEGADLPENYLSLNLADPGIREDLRAESQGGEVTPSRPIHGEDPVYMIYTSGTTGTPKGAINLHEGVAWHLEWMRETFGGGEHVVMNKAPVAFDVGVAEVLSPLSAGGTVVLPPADWWPGDSRALVSMIESHRVSVLSIVPSMLRALLEAGVRPGALDSLRHLLLGGEAVPADLVEAVREATSARIHGLYGPSEAAMDVMWVEYTPEVPLRAGQALLGHAEPGVGVQVVEPGTTQEVRPGEAGELLIFGVQVGGGYFRRPELTAAAFDTTEAGERRYRTGDLVRFDTGLGMYEFRGRLGDQVKVRGNRVELGEVEAALRAVPGVSNAAARLVGEELWGYVTGIDLATAASDAEGVRAQVADALPAYAVPGHIVVMEALPVSANGKLDRAALPQQR